MSERYPQLNDYYVFGHGLGATVAIELSKMSEKVQGLVLVDLPHSEKQEKGDMSVD